MKNLKYEIFRFKQAVANNNFEEKREREQKLRSAFAELGLDTETINYIVSNLKRYVEIEQAYARKCEEMSTIRDIISKAYRILF